MNTRVPFAALMRHFLLTLNLNFRSTQALIYGYLVPILFLLAFGSVFRSDTPPLLAEMGQILTISILGGACFGLPTALVSERERGIWRRYHLLPVSSGWLIASTLAARLILVGSAAALQILLARLVYHTPFPVHPGQIAVAFLVVTVAFMGLGLLIAALANDVPAVQALGQCLFLPMILIGGVGVPLAVLPLWAQRISAFMPGRYAVEVLQRCFTDPQGLRNAGFSVGALIVIGATAGISGAKLFRWDPGRRLSRSALAWVGVALLYWIAVGLGAAFSGHLQPVAAERLNYAAVTVAQMNQISYDDLPGDREVATRLAPPFKSSNDVQPVWEFLTTLKTWPPGMVGDPAQRVRNLLSLAAIADVSADLHEAEIARVVFDELQSRFTPEELRRILAWIVLNPKGGTVISQAPELGLRRVPPEPIIRERSALYAKKFLGRLLGKLFD